MFEEFVASFEDTGKSGKTFVKGSTFNPDKNTSQCKHIVIILIVCLSVRDGCGCDPNKFAGRVQQSSRAGRFIIYFAVVSP